MVYALKVLWWLWGHQRYCRQPLIKGVRAYSGRACGVTLCQEHWQISTSLLYSDSLCVVPQESFDSPIDRRSDYYRQKVREGPSAQAPAKPQPLITPPNVLTLFRIALVPVFAVLWFVPFRLSPFLCAVTFNLAALTDWADGFLARKVYSAVLLAHAIYDNLSILAKPAPGTILLCCQPPGKT